MRNTVIESFKPHDAQDAAQVVGVSMSTNPTHVAVFQGQGKDAIQRQQAMFAIVFQYSPGTTYIARREGRLVGVLRTVLSPHCRLGQSPEDSRKLAPLMQLALQDGGPRVREWLSVWIRHDPQEPHWHLGPLAVLPEVQGRGIGSKLLKHFCELMDADRQAAYLETDKPENVRLYQRFGFTVIHETIEVFGVRNYFMWRPSQS